MGDAALPRDGRVPVSVGGATVLASRLSYAGELGWELSVPPAWAVPVWDVSSTPAGASS